MRETTPEPNPWGDDSRAAARDRTQRRVVWIVWCALVLPTPVSILAAGGVLPVGAAKTIAGVSVAVAVGGGVEIIVLAIRAWMPSPIVIQ